MYLRCHVIAVEGPVKREQPRVGPCPEGGVHHREKSDDHTSGESGAGSSSDRLSEAIALVVLGLGLWERGREGRGLKPFHIRQSSDIDFSPHLKC